MPPPGIPATGRAHVLAPRSSAMPWHRVNSLRPLLTQAGDVGIATGTSTPSMQEADSLLVPCVVVGWARTTGPATTKIHTTRFTAVRLTVHAAPIPRSTTHTPSTQHPSPFRALFHAAPLAHSPLVPVRGRATHSHWWVVLGVPAGCTLPPPQALDHPCCSSASLSSRSLRALLDACSTRNGLCCAHLLSKLAFALTWRLESCFSHACPRRTTFALEQCGFTVSCT